MDTKLLEKVEDELHDALELMVQKGLKSASDIECAKNALSGIKKAEELMEKDYDEGRSGRTYPYYEGSFGSYNGSSHARRSMGTYDRRYSGHDMRRELERMMEEADSERERLAIREALNKM